MKRVLSAVLALLLSAGLCFSGICEPPVSALAVTAPEELSYNSGHRDTVCTALSDAAKKYYSGSYSIENLQKLSGNDLKKALAALMTDTDAHSAHVSYKMLTKYFSYIDAEDGKAGTVLFYSDSLPLEANGSVKATTISREHVWPKAHGSFHETKGGADLHHLRPSDSIVNANRSDYCFGYVNKSDKNTHEDRLGNKNTGKIAGWCNVSADRFEPLDNVKGDVARILLFVYVRWDEPNLYTDDASKQDADDKNNDGKKVIESLDTLFKWMETDPVDTWEMSRNDLVQKVQGNRNVFIDHPELAYAMFNRTAPEGVAISTTKTGSSENITTGNGTGSGSQDTSKDTNKNTDPHATVTKKTLKIGQKAFQIKISYREKDAVITYSSSNNKVAKVSKAGKITPIKAGKATITVTIKQNGQTYKSKIAVTVKE
ncbi:MAG: endonuclease [Lachnospiraceae bacterium]|nr:endonuclease [Lachnospiraceae bacterium]